MILKKIRKKIYVYGLGISGMSLAIELNKNNCNTVCWDDNKFVRAKAKKKNLNLTELEDVDFKDLDYLVLSPGISHRVNKPHLVANYAKKYGTKIISDLEFLSFLKYKKKLIGITGTNGKSTTTKFLENSISFGKKINARSCGNIGLPFTDLNFKKNTNEIILVEASSFQLDRIEKLKFDIAILLNLSPDHLDWHKSVKSYIEAKLKIFKNQDRHCFAIICIDSNYTKKIADNFKKKFKSNLILVSTKKKIANGIYIQKNKHGLIINNELIGQSFLISRDKIKFTPGRHNHENLLATYVVSHILKIPYKTFINSVTSLKNLEHRIEFVGSYKNVSFYNDSKSTNINSALSAIDSLENIFWLLGGREKKGGIKGIGKKLKKILRAFPYGEAGMSFKNYLKKNAIHCKSFLNLEEAFFNALNQALKLKKNVNILLSPACSSYDQFKNFEERGIFFKRLALKYIKNE